MANIVENLKDRFENRRVKAIVGNLDFFRLIEECLKSKDNTNDEKLLKKLAYENLKKTCLTLNPRDIRILLAYLQTPRSHPISNILKEAISRSDLTYEEWCRAVDQTFYTDNPKK